MNEQEIVFEGDEVYRLVPLPEYGGEVCKLELVMTKEIFIECYKKWIDPQSKSEDKNE